MENSVTLSDLGMDGGYGQTEYLGEDTNGPSDNRSQQAEAPDHFITRDGKVFAGTHLLIDLRGADRLNEIDHIEQTLKECVDVAKATLLHIHLHHFTPEGVSGVAVLAESHISIHTWPERGYAALDVFMCGDADPHACVPVLKRAFCADAVEVQEELRGLVGK